MRLIIATVIAVLAINIVQAGTAENVNKSDEFVATHEWQVIREGQGIPKGLHVRINMQTGVKEAKLLDESERGTALQSQAGEDDKGDQKPLALEHQANIIEESVRKAKEQKRSYAELRKAYKDFQKNFRTDGEVIVQLLEQYRNFSKTPLASELKPKFNVLDNLEYMLHQIDNALVFIDSGGLEDVLLPIVVNDTNTDLKVSAMRVLGALTANNPKAQIKVFERNFGSHLAQILMTSTNSAEVSSALHALGAMLRKFPLAQERILSTIGTQAFISVLSNSQVELRNKAKVVTLISDLLLEKRSAFENNMDASEAIAQYALIELETWLSNQGYCAKMEAVLSKDYVQLLDQPETVEQFSVALESTEQMCRSLWSKSATLRHALLTLRNRYARSEDEYRLEVSQALTKVCANFFEQRSHSDL
ncbi:CG10420 [Drosophila busckii]|uniref:Nucleotide exchange factor SIL1 n=1 Tax=Drosophila busckii TaxID=30019 RepID=A0A0M3QY19_DROBS|nr:nucleotide exchange factor Sil1 [Drosophila busckii]ALC46903.1 CG10420 [Drosophila busckii]